MSTVRRSPESPTPRSAPTAQPAAPTAAPARNEATKASTPVAKAPAPADTFATGKRASKPPLPGPEFRTQADGLLQRAGVPAAERARIGAHLKKLEGAELERESRLLQHALGSPNADRAVSTYDRLLSLSQESKRAGERLTPEIREALVKGVADPRTASTTGQEGILGKRQAEEAARALVDMPQAQYDTTRSLLSRAGQGSNGQLEPGADAGAERSLLLKSIAARGDRFRESFMDKLTGVFRQTRNSEAERAMQEVRGFANEVRGMDRAELIRTTSALDLERANTSRVNPDDLRANNDARGDNDGLYQRWEDSCGPTTAQMTRAEADPVYARQLHKDGLNNPAPTSATAREQQQVLEKERFVDGSGREVTLTAEQAKAYREQGTLPNGITAEAGGAVSRLGSQARERLPAQLDAAQAAQELNPTQRSAVEKLVNGQTLSPAEQAQADAGLAALRRRDGGSPTATEVNAMRADAARGGNGMRLNFALADITRQSTHIDYKTNWVGRDGLGAAHLREFNTRLQAGQDVPIRVSDARNSGGHFMLVSDVRGEGDNRRYLVSDPWSGRTSWVNQRDLLDPNSGFLDKQFGLGWSRVSHFYTE